jgi:hypothetical protein
LNKQIRHRLHLNGHWILVLVFASPTHLQRDVILAGGLCVLDCRLTDIYSIKPMLKWKLDGNALARRGDNVSGKSKGVIRVRRHRFSIGALELGNPPCRVGVKLE